MPILTAALLVLEGSASSVLQRAQRHWSRLKLSQAVLADAIFSVNQCWPIGPREEIRAITRTANFF